MKIKGIGPRLELRISVEIHIQKVRKVFGRVNLKNFGGFNFTGDGVFDCDGACG